MMTLALVYAMRKVFTSHVYRYKGKYHLQGDRGPIGHILTGVAARLIMIWFDIKFQELVKQLGINLILYMRYVDDAQELVEKLRGKVRFDKTSKTLVNDDPDCQLMMTDQQMMKLLQDIADSVTTMIRWEADFPSNHDDDHIPMLDVKVKLDKLDRQEPLKFRFYQKPIVNKNVISANSCTPKSMIFST